MMPKRVLFYDQKIGGQVTFGSCQVAALLFMFDIACLRKLKRSQLTVQENQPTAIMEIQHIVARLRQHRQDQNAKNDQ
jgi:hypothetical protein